LPSTCLCLRSSALKADAEMKIHLKMEWEMFLLDRKIEEREKELAGK
jgi:hypothetical protein